MVDLVYGKLLLPVVGAACETSAPEGLGIAESERLAALLKALADPVRLRLFSRIAAATDSVCVCDIQNVGVAQSTVSHHLRKLREAGLIESERRGSWVHYRAVPGGLAGLRTVVDLESQPVS
ncbi:MAG: helix-turn-helix transcriptional regulator [Actinomycetales bacterium]|nr:helix-turn-helix transcriptional regulator [Actinomycetales bacterium]